MENNQSFVTIILSFTGGLALFLYGIRLMSSGLKKASGERMRFLISKVTGNWIYGMLAGAFATVIVQSSSTIIATLVGLVQSGLMSCTQSLAVILGAEIGTTAMAQLVAFRLHEYALVFFAVGFVLTAFGKKESLRFTGEAVSGFGLLFFGLKLMSESTTPLQSYAPFLSLLHYLDNPVFGVFAGMAVTALMHSSAAFIGIVITLAQHGSLSLDAGILLLLGANIGTCITGVLASAGMMRAAKRVALAQVLFNLTGVLLFMPFIHQYAEFIRFISPSAEGYGVSRLAIEVPRQIANAHSFLNLFMALFILPFLSLFDRLLNRLLPDDPEEIRLLPAVWYLKDSALSTPLLALSYAKAEVARMGSIAGKMVHASLYPFMHSDSGRDAVFPNLSIISGLNMREEKLDFLETRITDYLIKISRNGLNERESKELFSLMNIVRDLESIGDVIETLSVKLVNKKRGLRSDLTEEGKYELMELHNLVCREIEQLADAIFEMDAVKAEMLLKGDDRFRQLAAQAEIAHLKRVFLVPESEVTHDIHMELANVLKQIHHYSKSIAGSIVVS
ncbi:MAG: Na/Pi cotransporter family protein [Chlorobiaceae bacterium]